jgi:uncharacterized protein (DUF885 family)
MHPASTLFALPLLLASLPSQETPGYQDLVTLFEQWREFQSPPFHDNVPDYTRATMSEQRRRLPELQERLAAMDTRTWPVAKLIDYHLVRAEMNGLEFDHRVLRPWARNPNFYTTVISSQSDTPRREGPVIHGAIEIWRLDFPLPEAEVRRLQARLRAIPAILDQARGNLVEDARDLWVTGIRTQRGQRATMTALAGQLAAHHPHLVAHAEQAAGAIDDFRAWLEEQLPSKNGSSGVGISNYDWYLRNVHLVPYSWEDELRLMERELARATAHLALEEHNNRDLPPLDPVEDPDQWQRVSNGAVTELMRFLDEHEILTVEPYMDAALRVRLSGFTPAEGRSFFAQVDVREPLLLRCHGIHWFDLARMEQQPHASPIRRLPLLYNIWDSRAEGLATAMEEMMMSAGLLAGKPRSRELVYVMVAQRAARAIAGLRMHSNEFDIDEARHFASVNTPRGFMQENGGLNWGEQKLYLEQPGYGTSYITGKLLIEDLLAEYAVRHGNEFTLKGFMDELMAEGVIPVTLIAWEMVGRQDPILKLR